MGRAVLPSIPQPSRLRDSSVKITQVQVMPLVGTPVGSGWPDGTAPEENLHTLIEVCSDEGPTGIGSCFTSGALIEAALQLLRPLLIGESAVEPERVSENLRQSMFWEFNMFNFSITRIRNVPGDISSGRICT